MRIFNVSNKKTVSRVIKATFPKTQLNSSNTEPEDEKVSYSLLIL